MLMLGASGRDISLVDGEFDARLCFTWGAPSVFAEATGRKLRVAQPGLAAEAKKPVCSPPISL